MQRLINKGARAELYIADCEGVLGTPLADWQNVLHSCDPATVASESRAAVEEWFGRGVRGPWQQWSCLSRDLGPGMKLRAR